MMKYCCASLADAKVSCSEVRLMWCCCSHSWSLYWASLWWREKVIGCVTAVSNIPLLPSGQRCLHRLLHRCTMMLTPGSLDVAFLKCCCRLEEIKIKNGTYKSYQWRRHQVLSGPVTLPSLPSLSLPLLFPSSLLLPFPSLPLEVGPLNTALWGSAVSSPSGSGAEPQRKSNLVHFSLKIWHLVTPILPIFLTKQKTPAIEA